MAILKNIEWSWNGKEPMDTRLQRYHAISKMNTNLTIVWPTDVTIYFRYYNY